MKRVLALLPLLACDEALDQRLAIIAAPRVLAVIAEPAEARPGTEVTYRAVIASPDGPLDATPAWAFCTSPKPPTEDNAVSVPCVDGSGLVPLAPGTAPMTATGALPMDGCLRFGPDVPPGGFRPRDADPTGGFYQPVRVDTELAPLAFGLSRITCNLANATPEAFRRYASEYVPNVNPTLEANIDPLVVAPGGSLAITAAWPAGTAETFLYYDRAPQRLIDQRESLRVSWFATSGTFPVDATLADSDATSATTIWTAPSTATEATVWIVLRDSRGGMAVETRSISVR